MIAVGSTSASIAKTCTILPEGCLSGSKATNFPSMRKPVSSAVSRFAAVSGSSFDGYSPFGIDHAPTSFLCQKGPPGWTRNTCSDPCRRRHKSSPALVFVIPPAMRAALPASIRRSRRPRRFGTAVIGLRLRVSSARHRQRPPIRSCSRPGRNTGRRRGDRSLPARRSDASGSPWCKRSASPHRREDGGSVPSAPSQARRR